MQELATLKSRHEYPLIVSYGPHTLGFLFSFLSFKALFENPASLLSWDFGRASYRYRYRIEFISCGEFGMLYNSTFFTFCT